MAKADDNFDCRTQPEVTLPPSQAIGIVTNEIKCGAVGCPATDDTI